MDDPSELLQKYPRYFESLGYLQKIEANPRRRVFIFSQPRSGSTLLLRLLTGACYTRCVGDRAPSYYESLLNIYEEINNNSGKYCNGYELEKEFPDQYRGYAEREKELENFKWNASGLLFANNYGSGWAKTTTIGFANSITKQFSDMLREIYDGDDLRIVWLRRDHDDIVKSLMATPYDMKQGDEAHALKLLEKQRNEQNASYQLGDIVIKYSDLIVNYDSILRRLNPIYTPDKYQVDQIMKNILR